MKELLNLTRSPRGILPRGFSVEVTMKNKLETKKLVVLAMLCAMAYLCTFAFKFKVAFLTFDFKDAIIAVASLAYGPLYGVAASAVAALLEFVTFSDTGFYGLVMNFLSSATFALTCGLIYKYKRSLSGAVIAVGASVLTVTAVMMLANMFITPFYMGVPRSEVMKLLPKLLLPFNLCKSSINAAVTVLIYKPIVSALRRLGLIKAMPSGGYKFGVSSVVIIVGAIAVSVAVILVLLLELEGTFKLIG